MEKDAKRYDVVVYRIEDRVIDSIVGSDMPMETGHSNAVKRLDTISQRLNDLYDAEIVPTGKYKKGDKLAN